MRSSCDIAGISLAALQRGCRAEPNAGSPTTSKVLEHLIRLMVFREQVLGPQVLDGRARAGSSEKIGSRSTALWAGPSLPGEGCSTVVRAALRPA